MPHTHALGRLFDAPVPDALPIRANDPVGFTGRFRSWLDAAHEWSQCQDPALVREGVMAAREWLDKNRTPELWIVDPVIAIGDDVNAFLSMLDLDAAQRDRVEHHRPFFASFWLAMLLPGNGGWRRNPPGSTEDQARHLLRLVER